MNTSDVRTCVCLDARRVARHLTQIYDHALRTSGLKITQFQLLAAVGEAEPVTQQRLAELMGMDRTTLTRNLALLVRESFIEVNVGEDDRRERYHRLTPAGRKAVKDAMPLWQAVHKRLLLYLREAKGGAALTETRQVLAQLAAFGDER